MLTSIHNESTFESAIIQSLVEQGGYMETTPSDFSQELALDKKQVIAFLTDTQSKQWEKLQAIHGAEIEKPCYPTSVQRT